MDNPTSQTSLEKFIDWHYKNGVHMDRFVGIAKRQREASKLWADALREYLPGSFEMKIVFDKLSDEFGKLEEESIENITDIRDDMSLLYEVFNTFQSEIAKIPDDTP